MKITLANKKDSSKQTLDITKFDWLKQAKTFGIIYQNPQKITVGSNLYTEGQSITLNDNEHLVLKIEDNSITLIDQKENEQTVTIDENNWPVEDEGKDLFNIHPSKSPKHAQNDIRRTLNANTIKVSETTWTHNGHKIAVETETEIDENAKKFFFVTQPNGEEVDVPISPYADNSIANLWVDAGCPQFLSPTGGNWTKEELEQYIETNPMWYKDSFGNIQASEATKRFIKAFKKHKELEKIAENQVNMGAEVNEGMQAAPVEPTVEQEQQMKADFNADLDQIRGHSGLQDFKESLSPEMKSQLLSSLSKLKTSFPQLKPSVKNPVTRQYLMQFLSQMSNSDVGKINNFKAIMSGLQGVTDREMHTALAPDTLPTQQVQNVQNMNPAGLR